MFHEVSWFGWHAHASEAATCPLKCPWWVARAHLESHRPRSNARANWIDQRWLPGASLYARMPHKSPAAESNANGPRAEIHGSRLFIVVYWCLLIFLGSDHIHSYFTHTHAYIYIYIYISIIIYLSIEYVCQDLCGFLSRDLHCQGP